MRPTRRPSWSAPLRRRACVAAAVLSLATAARSAAQVVEDPPTTAWKQAVAWHVPGQADSALVTAASIPHWRVPHALRRPEVARDRFFLTRALVLHTDLAIVERQRTGHHRGGNTGSVLLEDGNAVGRRQRSPHWDVAMQIAGMLAAREDAEARRTARMWYRTANALFLHWAEGTLVYLDGGLRHYPDDAVLHVLSGTMHQMYADRRVQQFITGGRAIRVGPDAPKSASAELRRAEVALRRAVRLDPTLAEARIRLAHVAGDAGRPDEAIALVQEALRNRLPPFFEVYATLILGRNLSRAGRLDDARAAFDRAATLAPEAQAPRIGRSTVALAAGRPADALAALTDFIGPGRPVPPDDEEWSRYFRVHDPVALDQLAALRAEVR